MQYESMRKSQVLLFAFALICMCAIAGCTAQNGSKTSEDKEPIKIGFIGPLAGDAANIGQNSKAAVEIAVEEINNAGGVKGRKIEVIYEDGACEGKTASNAANKLININKVPVILGGACSGETSAFTGAAEQSKTVVLSYCSSAPAISNAGDYIFRNIPSDLYQGAFAAEYLFNKLNIKRIAILYAKNDYHTGIKETFINSFAKIGGEITAEEGYEQTSRDLRTQLAKIKAANPEALYFLGYTEASISGLKQAKELGLDMQIIGSDSWDDSKIWEEAGNAGEGVMYSTIFAPLNAEFKTKMREKIGNDEITICSPQAHDGVKLLAKVIEKAGTKSEDIKNELYKTVYTNGVSSEKIKFDENGDLIGASYLVKIVKDGKAVEMK